MSKKIRIRFLSVLLGLILTVSAPLCAYADSDSVIPDANQAVSGDAGSSSETAASDTESLTYNDLEAALTDENAIILESEDSDNLYLVEIEDDEEEEDSLVSEDEPDFDEEDAEDISDSEDISFEEDSDEPLPDADIEEEDEDLSDDDLLFEEDLLGEESSDDFALSENTDDIFAVADEDTDSISAAEATVYYSGYCGASAKWQISYDSASSTWALTISGSGAMYNYGTTYYNGRYVTSAPWGSYYYYPDKIIVSKGITSIGSYAFYGMTSPKKVSIGSTVTSIGTYAFYGCSSLAAVTLPSSLTSLGRYSLYSFSDIYYPGSYLKYYNMGGYNSMSGSGTIHYTTSIKSATVTLAKSKYGYTGKAIKPAVTVKKGYTTLKKGTDYTVTYKNNKKRGTATVVIKGIHNYYGSVKKTFKIVKKSISSAKVASIKNRAYTGKAIKPAPKVRVKVGSKYVVLKKGRDYTITYKNNKKLSTSSSKAQLIIKGKGNYKGTIKRSFKIVKGSPGLKFSASKVTRTARTTFTRKATKKASASLKLTYKSSNTKVATVNSKTGKVTPKKVGTTKITVTSKATKYYKAGKASYTLKIRPFKFSELKYSFSNYSTSYIPLSTFRIFFGSVEASSYYNAYYNLGSGGVCYGMSASSIMFNTAGSGITTKNFSSSASHPSALGKYDTYKSSGLYLNELIEGMFVSQTSSQAQRIKSRNMNNIKAMVNSVKTGKPVIVEMFYGGGGHAVVGYKVKSISSSVVRLYVYDCNYPSDSSRYITLYKSGSSYTGWSYPISYYTTWSSSGGRITFTSEAQYKTIWKNRKGSSAISKMIVTSDDFEIRGAQGELVASMNNGEFDSNSDDVYMMLTAGDQPDAHLVYMPVGAYTITNTSAGFSGLDVTALNVDQSITVSTSANTVMMNVDDANETNTVSFEAPKGDAYEVSLMSALSCAEGMEEVRFAGEGTGSEITLGTEGSSCIVDNAADVALEVNGEDVAYVVFDGEAVIDE